MKLWLQDAGHRDAADPAQHLQGEAGAFLRRFEAVQPPAQGRQRQQAGRALGDEGGPGHAGHPHVEDGDEEEIQPNVAQRGADEENQRGAGIAQGVEHAGADVVQKQENEAAYVDIQVQGGVGEDVGRGMDGAQDGAGQQQAADGQHGAETTAGQEGGGDSGFHLGKPLRAEILRDHHRAADVAAHGHRHEQHGHRIGSAHRRQGVLAHDFPAIMLSAMLYICWNMTLMSIGMENSHSRLLILPCVKSVIIPCRRLSVGVRIYHTTGKGYKETIDF